MTFINNRYIKSGSRGAGITVERETYYYNNKYCEAEIHKIINNAKQWKTVMEANNGRGEGLKYYFNY